MRIAEIFSFGWDDRHGGRGGYGGSKRHYRRGGHYKSNYGYRKGDRHNGRGLLGILGGN